MESPKPILIWDWDGTLVDTITYKYGGIWDDIFPDDLEKQTIVKEFLHSPEGKGINRYGLIQKALGLENLSDEELKNHPGIQRYADQYKKFSEESAVKNGVYPNTKEVLERLFSDGYSMYIISGGGSDEDLKKMAEQVGIGKYFKDIYGFGSAGSSLTSFDKKANFERIINKGGEEDPSKYIVIGDSVSDYNFADSVTAKFVGFIREWNKWEGYEDKLKLISNVSELEPEIDEDQPGTQT
jgi:phosphoglycolate phosphatase-like HAD superfamily hydrolase